MSLDGAGLQTSTSCGCKGIRVCARCESSERVKKLNLSATSLDHFADYTCYVYDQEGTLKRVQSSSDDTSLNIDGISLLLDFLTSDEEERIVQCIDADAWALSQSGRRKQDYGPRVNFKQQKVKCDRFVGVPDYADLVLDRLKSINADAFGDYIPFELCNLEYDNERHSSIEMHQDDKWIWGERLISLNLLSDTVMTFEHAERKMLVFVLLPRRSILLFRGEARYILRHGIFPWHIDTRRIALTMREAGKPFLEGGDKYEEFGKELLNRSRIRLPKLSDVEPTCS